MVVLLLSLLAYTVIYGAMALMGGLPLKLELRTLKGRKDIFRETFGFDVDAPHLVNNPDCY